jgi:hypothetical protein
MGLFSDLPVPRKNSSLLAPPVAVAATPKPRDVAATPKPREVTATPTAETAASQNPDEFAEHESPTGSLSVAAPMRDETIEPDDDEPDLPDFEVVPGPRFTLGSATGRRAAILAGAFVIAALVVLVVRRVASPSRSAATTATARSEASDSTKAPGDDIPGPMDDSDLESSEPDPAMARELRREARRLLVMSKAEEGVGVARRAIRADPNDPEGYILLAAGLQDLGRWQESRDVFAKCVHESNGKPNAECVYFATRSK